MLEQTADMSTALHNLSNSARAPVRTTTPCIIVNSTEGLDDDYADLPESLSESIHEAHEAHDCQETLIADILQAEQDDPLDAEDTADLVHDKPQVQLLWELPVRLHM